MNIRKLGKDELFEAYLISAYCFHMRVEDVEAKREEAEADLHENWGAFDEDGTMMARMLNHHYQYYLDGESISAGGIGIVSTLPEYRNSGAIRKIFEKLLQDAYTRGEIISTLYPFKQAFYRKAGYEVVTYMNEYSFPPAVLEKYRFDGEIKAWKPGSSVAEFLALYQEFAPAYNLSMVRDEKKMAEKMKVEKPYMDRKFSYILKREGKAIAYVIFTDIRHDPAAIMQVEECVWTSGDGFRGILGFLARFEADYGEIKLVLPAGIDLLRVIESPRAFEIHKRTLHNFMVRVINAKRLLEVLQKPAGCEFTVKVTDEILSENERIFRVRSRDVEEITDPSVTADMELSVRALGQMAVGAINFEEAKLREDVIVNTNEEMLRMVFREKHIYVAEYF